MPVATVFENLEAGLSIKEIIEEFQVTPEQIEAVLEFAARTLDPPSVPITASALTLDWSQCPAVESISGKVSGAWVFKDTRMPVSTVFENFESGASLEEIMEWFDVTREQIVAVLDFAARSLQAPPPPPTAAAPPIPATDAHSF
jgi:uncharacterized protein (DUF433 family)